MKIPISGMAPLLQVFDMPRSLAFYRDLLGFEIVEPQGCSDDVDWVLLKLHHVELMLNTAYEKPHRPVEPDAGRVEAHGDTALYFGCPDIDLVCKHLVDKNLSLRELGSPLTA